MEQFLQGNVPLRHLLNEETLFMSWRGSAIKEVNDWNLNVLMYVGKYNWKLYLLFFILGLYLQYFVSCVCFELGKILFTSGTLLKKTFMGFEFLCLLFLCFCFRKKIVLGIGFFECLCRFEMVPHRSIE